jgi:hypothetical protein
MPVSWASPCYRCVSNKGFARKKNRQAFFLHCKSPVHFKQVLQHHQLSCMHYSAMRDSRDVESLCVVVALCDEEVVVFWAIWFFQIPDIDDMLRNYIR